jgi:hypothetical protein
MAVGAGEEEALVGRYVVRKVRCTRTVARLAAGVEPTCEGAGLVVIDGDRYDDRDSHDNKGDDENRYPLRCHLPPLLSSNALTTL